MEPLLRYTDAKKMESYNDFYVLPGIQHGNRLHFAINNVNLHSNTPDEKNDFHGTF